MITEIKIVIVGLGKVGSKFLDELSLKPNRGINIVAVVERDVDAPGVQLAKSKHIEVFSDVKDVIDLGDIVDVIFDLSGNIEVRKALRRGLAESANRHTVVAPGVIAFLIWDLIADEEPLSIHHETRGY